MTFSSLLFCFYFLPAALVIYHLTAAVVPRWRNLALTVLSYVFYGWASPIFTLLLAATTGFDFIAGRLIARLRWRENGRQPRGGRAAGFVLAASIAINLAVLGVFKYAGFFGEIVERLLGTAAGGPNAPGTWGLALPLGLSFYTFQSISYTVDVYRGRTAPARRLTDFACYVAMFPHLVAGPIVRFRSVARQLRHRTETLQGLERGLRIFSVGLAKKVLLANACGEVADATFGAATPAALDAWLGLLAFAFQIYFDFSGYSEMAVGLASMFGLRLPKNFNRPYCATSLRAFWLRWHISLSSWFRDYVYIPLGGSRRGRGRTLFNLLLVMTAAGLWHGAAWNYVAWGAYHGASLAAERVLRARGWSLPRHFAMTATFAVVLIGWILFRAPSLNAALAYATSLLGTAPAHNPGLLSAFVRTPYHLLVLAAAASVTWLVPPGLPLRRAPLSLRAGICVTLLLLSVTGIALQGYRPFLYFFF